MNVEQQRETCLDAFADSVADGWVVTQQENGVSPIPLGAAPTQATG